MKHERISVDSSIMMGKPCITGTRIPVEQVLRELSEGLLADDLIQMHPQLTEDDIMAAVRYAADVVRQTWLLTKSVLLGEPDDAIPG